MRARYPQFAGHPAAVAGHRLERHGSYFVRSSKDNRGRFLGSPGFTVPTTIDELAGDRSYAEISTERSGLLGQTDVVAWITVPGTENAAAAQQPGFAALRVGQEDRVLSELAAHLGS